MAGKAKQSVVQADQNGEVVVEVECKGITPLLMSAAQDVWGPRAPKDRPDEEVAAERLYKDADGELCIPAANFFACLKNAGKSVKFDGRRNISTTKGTLLPRLLSIQGEYLALLGSKQWVTDRRMGRAKDGTPIPAIRPRFDDWGFRVTLIVDTSEVSLATIQKLIGLAGREAGLGAYRPTCGGYYGQFKLDKFEVVDFKVVKEVSA